MTELTAIQTAVRTFAQRSVRPALETYDRQPDSGFPWSIVQQGEAMGLTLMTVPEAWGGAGMDLVAAGVALEEVAAVCPGFATLFAASLWGIAPLVLAADEVRGRRLLETSPAEGAATRLAALVAPEMGRTPTVRAVPQDNGYRLDGEAPFVFNAGVAGLYTLFAEAGEGMICAALPAGSPGLHVSSPIAKLGLQVAPAGDLTFEGVWVPEENLLARSGDAEALLRRVEAWRQGLIGAVAVGILRAALREATAYAQQRRQGGKLIIHHHAVATLLAEMRMGLEAARAVVRQALGEPEDPDRALLARLHATEAACAATTDAVQVFGGYGYMADYPVEKLMCDARQLALIGGSNSRLRLLTVAA